MVDAPKYVVRVWRHDDSELNSPPDNLTLMRSALDAWVLENHKCHEARAALTNARSSVAWFAPTTLLKSEALAVDSATIVLIDCVRASCQELLWDCLSLLSRDLRRIPLSFSKFHDPLAGLAGANQPCHSHDFLGKQFEGHNSRCSLTGAEGILPS